MKNDDFWIFVGGKVSFGEDSQMAVIREYLEETGANFLRNKVFRMGCTYTSGEIYCE